MKVAILHNAYGLHSGEETVVERDIRLLRQHGHEVIVHWRGSAELAHLRLGRWRALGAGVFAPGSRAAIRRLLEQNAPVLVHFHNLFPLISPSVLPEFRRHEVPAVMTVHNYRLVCPTGLHMSKKTLTVCEKCCGGKEYWCILRNCEADVLKSIGYALRNWVARRFRLFRNNVAVYMCLTQFQRQRLIGAGFPADRIDVVPNMAMDAGRTPAPDRLGTYVGYAGRISPEKGVDKLLAAARELPSIPFQAAGPCGTSALLLQRAPRNFRFLGCLKEDIVPQFLRGSRFTVLCSTWFEGFPMVVVEAMLAGKAVIAPRMGGLPEIVEDHVTGLLFEPGNAADLAEKIRSLWDRPAACKQMGQAGREKALREYSSERYYERLMAVYEKAVAVGFPSS